jgi:hypothetical protein
MWATREFLEQKQEPHIRQGGYGAPGPFQTHKGQLLELPMRRAQD